MRDYIIEAIREKLSYQEEDFGRGPEMSLQPALVPSSVEVEFDKDEWEMDFEELRRRLPSSVSFSHEFWEEGFLEAKLKVVATKGAYQIFPKKGVLKATYCWE